MSDPELKDLAIRYLINDIWLEVAEDARQRQSRYRDDQSRFGALFGSTRYWLSVLVNGSLSHRAKRFRDSNARFGQPNDASASSPPERLEGDDLKRFNAEFIKQYRADTHGIRKLGKRGVSGTVAVINNLLADRESLTKEIDQLLHQGGPEFSKIADNFNNEDPLTSISRIFEVCTDPKAPRNAAAMGPTERDLALFQRQVNESTSQGMIREMAFEGLAFQIIFEAARSRKTDDDTEVLLINRAGQRVLHGLDLDHLSRVERKLQQVKGRHNVPDLASATPAERRKIADDFFVLCQERSVHLTTEAAKIELAGTNDPSRVRSPFYIFTLVANDSSLDANVVGRQLER